MAEAAPNSPSPRPNQIDKCASGGGRRADGGAFADLVRPGAGAVGRGFSHGFWMVRGGFVVGFVVGLWSVCVGLLSGDVYALRPLH